MVYDFFYFNNALKWAIVGSIVCSEARRDISLTDNYISVPHDFDQVLTWYTLQGLRVVAVAAGQFQGSWHQVGVRTHIGQRISSMGLGTRRVSDYILHSRPFSRVLAPVGCWATYWTAGHFPGSWHQMGLCSSRAVPWVLAPGALVTNYTSNQYT